MATPLLILIVEDSADDAEMIVGELRRAGFDPQWRRVESETDFLAGIKKRPDIILADYSMPQFTGLRAVKLLRESGLDIPFILISGTVGEEIAVEAMKYGAADYLLKDRIARLGNAVKRALEDTRDRRQRERAEEALRQSEARLQAIVENLAEGLVVSDLSGQVLHFNRAALEMHGFSGVGEVRRHLREFADLFELSSLDGKVWPVEQWPLARVLRDEKVHNLETRIRRLRSDWQRVFSYGGTLVRDTSGQPTMAVVTMRDITERVNLEARFIEAQKMEVIGQLAGGVAHDFNNILAVIISYSDLITQRLALDDEFTGYVETIRSAAERACGLTRQLLIFSRKQQVLPVVLNLNEVVREMDKILRRLIDEHIEMTVALNDQIGAVRADSGYVGQVLMNLAVNARDAMPEGGKLTITTDNVTFGKAGASERSGELCGDFVMLSVSDTGTGMTDEVKAHIFEPFFTTKPKGKGTGLGLATCQTIMQQSGGHIAVESEPGKGATFKICFPRIDLPLDVSPHAKSGPAPRGTETLLVVEDDPALRKLARYILETQGYTVLSASNGREAISMVRDHQGPPIRLVVSDVIMPLMGGKVMSEWLKTANPGLKILFTSGYTGDAIFQQGVLSEEIELLPKPYSATALACKVREMLDQATGP